MEQNGNIKSIKRNFSSNSVELLNKKLFLMTDDTNLQKNEVENNSVN